MTSLFDDYSLIAGTTGARGSLWRGPDHLLVVEGRGWLIPFAEVYRRVDYVNIQSLTLVRTSWYLWGALVWGAAFLLFALLTWFATRSDRYVLITVAIPTILLVIPLLLHLLRGPTCKCSLQTNVQLLPLRSLHRLRVAEPAIQLLASLCRQHQGELAAGEGAQLTSPSPAAPPPLVPPVAGTKPPWTGTIWTAVAGGMLVLWGLAVAAELFVPGTLFTLLDGLLGISALTLSIVALARSLRMMVPATLLGALWSGLASEVLAAGALYAVATAALIQQEFAGPVRLNPTRTFDNDRIIAALADFTFGDAGRWGWGVVGVGGVLVLVGLFTLATGGIGRARISAPPPASTPPPMPSESGS